MTKLNLNYTVHFQQAKPQGIGPGSTTEQWMEVLRGPAAKFPDGWGGWDTVREAHIRLLDEQCVASDREILRENTKYAPGYRGIVCGAGGALYFANAFAMLVRLRSLGCSLPVEFWHLGPHEMDPTMQRLAEDHGVRVIDARAFCLARGIAPRVLNGWELKPFSVLHSEFEEVVYLDADCIPVQNPSLLFGRPEYQQLGSIFWPDLPPNDRPEWLPDVCWRNVGMQPQMGRDFESGQFVIDKRRCSRALRAANWINQHSDWFYQFVFGDKSTFHLAWRKCGMDFAMPARDAGWAHPCIEQYDLDGNLMFLHACQGKDEIAAGNVPHLPIGQDVAAAKVIRDRAWSGRIYDWSEMSLRDADTAKRIAGVYRYAREGSGERMIELLAGGAVGVGRADCERRWSVTHFEGVPHIVVIGGGHKGSEIAMFLAREMEPGRYEGDWTAYERNHCILTRIGA